MLLLSWSGVSKASSSFEVTVTDMIDKIVTIQTGALTSIWAIVDLIVYLSFVSLRLILIIFPTKRHMALKQNNTL